VFPACGSDNSAIELTCDELFRFSGAKEWIDVCKDWEEGDDPVIDSTPKPDFVMPDDGEITLAIERIAQADEKTGFVPAYHFSIVRKSDGARVGLLDLRLGYVRNTYYGGNIGYTVFEPFRGHAYAQNAVSDHFLLRNERCFQKNAGTSGRNIAGDRRTAVVFGTVQGRHTRHALCIPF
jgi:tagatose 1,6-diphosphate aldolase